MKTGLAALIAAAAAVGIAAIAQKKEAEEEKNLLEAEQTRLEIEAQERAHQRQIEHEEKMAKAPRIPIYKPVEAKCPNCNGDRITDMQKGFIKCPYCDRVDKLIVDHYKVDLEGYEKKLKEEEIRRNQEMNKLMKEVLYWSAVSMFALMVLYSLTTLNGAVFLICVTIVTGMLVIRFPQLRLPAIWLYIMPIPLTNLLLKDENLKQKYTPKTRYWLVAGAWVGYLLVIALIVGFWNLAKHQLKETPSSSTPPNQTIVAEVETTEETTESIEFAKAEFTEDTVLEEFNCVQYKIPVSWTKSDKSTESTMWYAASQNEMIVCKFLEAEIDDDNANTYIRNLIQFQNETENFALQLTRITTINSQPIAIAEGKINDNSNQYQLTQYILVLPQGLFLEYIMVPDGGNRTSIQDEEALIASVTYNGNTSTEAVEEGISETAQSTASTTETTNTTSPIETTTATETKSVQETVPSVSGNLTSSENADFAAILKVNDYCDDSVVEFVNKYKTRKIEFDCNICDMSNHGSYATRYDILLTGGNYDSNNAVGAYFKFVDINITSDLKLTANIPDSIGVGTNLHVVAKIKEWDGTCIVLTPVSTEVR